MKKRICHITTVHNYNDNRIFYKECTSLSKSGYNVYLLACSNRDFVEDTINVIGLKKYKNRIKHFFLVSVIDVFRKSQKINAQVYHFHDPELIFIGLILKILGKKVIYDIHENNSASIMSKPYLKYTSVKKIIAKLLFSLEKVSSRIFDAIVTARPDISEKFIKYNPTTVRNFPILPKKNDNSIFVDKKKKTVIYVGGMSAIRGIKQLIQAFEGLGNYELWLLGRWESTEFQESCMKLKGWQNVKYLGVVKPYEVFSFIEKADAGIITFLPKENHLTTLATKPFEYMAVGLPVIMSNFPYWKSFFGDLAFYVDPNNSRDIRSKIVELFSNKKRRDDMSKAGKYKIFHEYNWEVENKKLIQLYSKLLNK